MSKTAFERRVERLRAHVIAQEQATEAARAERKEKARKEAEAKAKAEAEAKAAEEAASQQEPLPPLEEALAEGEPGEPINLEELTVKELQEIAQEHGIEGYSRMKKAELIAALEGGGADAGEA